MSVRYVNANALAGLVDIHTQNIIHSMPCVYVDGIKAHNQHFNLSEHDEAIRADERRKVIDEFLELLISETCEDCKECEPRLSTDWMPKFACCEEGYVKFYMKLAEQLKGELK